MRAFRLAERRGLLQGRSISQVQQVALNCLMAQDEFDAERERLTRVKLAMVAAGASVPDMFPEYMPPKPEPELLVSDDPTDDIRALIEKLGQEGQIGIEDFTFNEMDDMNDG